MTIHFIGAGPGDPELITLRGQRLIAEADCVYYAGSLVPEGVLEHAREDALVVDTAPMHLDQIMEGLETAHRQGKSIARVHSGDPSLYGAIAEQIRRLKALAIPYDITPGVPAYAAAAAELGCELTLPNVSQSVILTRTAVRASSMPENETLEKFAQTGATLAIHLSINNIARVVRDLEPHYGKDCPVVVAYRVGWPDSCYIHGTLGTIRAEVKKHGGITRTALIMVGRVLAQDSFDDSRLYAADHSHVLRDAATVKA